MKTYCTDIQWYDKDYMLKYFGIDPKTGDFFQEPINMNNYKKIPQDTEVIVCSRNCALNREVISSLPNLKKIVTRSTGFDHIDQACCAERGIPFHSIPNYSSDSVAEYVISMLLMLARNTQNHIIAKTNRKLNLELGFELKGKKVGIIGFGNIGKAVARMLSGFGVEIYFLDFTLDEKKEAVDPSYHRVSSVDEIFANCDIISLHCPLNEKTKHLINMDNVNTLKPGVIILNTARGAVLQTEALKKGLEEGIFAGVAIDVLEEENEVLVDPNHPLWESFLLNPKVLYTPHNAFLSIESIDRLWSRSFDAYNQE